ncbi:peptidase M28-like protein [Gelidibacter algens]|uniref:Peptidase M28-like protein n=1 Tax=Gelidibacter algens TaxID=49280 RepID=A0A1A7QZG9_9FLAO|nr:M28 family metallopeptidase [Gelidibacter algens]OBX24961.1 peptidase [Gelidibacter algens]RAJ24799.1 peptidase M28-like protein [Gelidibacter algens]
MKKLFIIAGIALTTLSCGTSQQQTPTVETIAPIDPTEYGTSITSDELKEMLYTFASDEFEGRETGEKGQKMAVEYLKQHYVDMNIPSPISEGDYFQEVPLLNQKSPQTEITVNGVQFKNYADYVMSGAASSQAIKASDIVYAGYGIEDEKYSSYEGLDVEGKIVLIKSGEPKNEDGTYVTSGAKEDTKWSVGRQALSSKRDVARKKGIKTLLIMDNAYLKMVANYMEAAAKSGSDGRITLKDKQEDMLQILVSEKLGASLLASIATDDTSKTVKTDLEIDVTSNSEEVNSENVVAFIKGSEKPDEIIVISAHLDHEGVKNGEIYNGADDDGSGTVAILEIAEAFKKAQDAGHGPKRSILFLHVTGEEKGLLGSSYYADIDPIFPLKNTVANLNIDMIGRIDPKRTGDRNYVYLIGSDKLSTELHNISEEVNKKYTNIALDYTYNDENDPNRFYYRSDHYNFAKNNVPIIFYFNGTHDDYHKPSDTPDKIEYDLLENRTRLVFYTAWELANREGRISVDKATE